MKKKGEDYAQELTSSSNNSRFCLTEDLLFPKSFPCIEVTEYPSREEPSYKDERG